MSNIIGIDLGTTITVVSYFDTVHNKPVIFKSYPSVIKISDNIIIGNEALELADSTTFFNIKRFIGKSIDKNLLNDLKFCSFNYSIIDDSLSFNAFDKSYSCLDLDSIFLSTIHCELVNALHIYHFNCVITVPAYFNNSQRLLTKTAGINAGFNVLSIINEPTAASLAYNLIHTENISDDHNDVIDYSKNNSKDDKDGKDNNNILVFDFGGGTLDLSVISIFNDVVEVVYSNGDNHLGGDDVDNLIVQFALSSFIHINNLPKDDVKYILSNKSLLFHLKLICENAKKKLSVVDSTNIFFDNFFHNIDLSVNLSRSDLDSIIKPILAKCKALVDDVVHKYSISSVVLVGGSTRLIPVVHLLSSLNCPLFNNIDPDSSVSIGACIHCFNLLKHSTNNFLLDRTSHNIGVETNGGKMCIIIPRNTIIPFSDFKYFTNTFDNQRSIDVNIYEGESDFVKNNLLVKKISKKITPNKSGLNKIKISFFIDDNNILSVSFDSSDNIIDDHDVHVFNV